jgi:hypothetical protein
MWPAGMTRKEREFSLSLRQDVCPLAKGAPAVAAEGMVAPKEPFATAVEAEAKVSLAEVEL